MCFEKVSVKIVTLQLLLHQVTGVRVCHFFNFVLSLSFLGWNKMEWDKEAEMALHFNGNLLPTLCCGFANRILGIAVLNPLMKWYSCDIQNVNFRNFL